MIDKVKLYIIDRWIICMLFLLLPLLSALNFSGKYAVVSLLFIGVFFYYYQNKSLKLITRSYPLILWLILTVYHWVNAMQNKVPEVDGLDLVHGLKIFACIGIFTFLARRNFDQTIKNLVICFFIYMLLSFVVNDSDSERHSGVMIATGLGQASAISGIYIAYYSLRNRLSIFKTVLLYVLPILVIILTQSRNSLAMIAIGIVGHAIAFTVLRGGNLRRSILTVSTLGIFAFGIFQFVVDNTGLGARLADTETAALTAEHNGLATGTVFDKIVGDRLVYYIKGWEFFTQSPLTGVGMWNYKYLTGGDYPLHTEYMVHLAEGGIIGASIWLLFIFLVFRGVIKSDAVNYIKIMAIFSLLEIMFSGIYARLFYYEFFYPVFGIAIALSSWGTKGQKKMRNV